MNQPFIIRPRATRDGFDLTGPTLPYGMWYRQSEHAANYARWRGVDFDAVIEFHDENGQTIRTVRHAAGAARW